MWFRKSFCRWIFLKLSILTYIQLNQNIVQLPKSFFTIHNVYIFSGGSKGRHGRAPPSSQPIFFFIFMQFLRKIWQIVGWGPFRVAAPTSVKSWIRHWSLWYTEGRQVSHPEVNLRNVKILESLPWLPWLLFSFVIGDPKLHFNI